MHEEGGDAAIPNRMDGGLSARRRQRLKRAGADFKPAGSTMNAAVSYPR
jgi:hypothetical protein